MLIDHQPGEVPAVSVLFAVPLLLNPASVLVLRCAGIL